MKKAIVIMSVIVTIGCIISIGGAYAATNYAISASKIGYTDNSSIGADNVQAAIDGTCTSFSKKLDELKKSMYPVGSIYISTKLSSPTAVASAIGGTWEAFGNGKVLRSSTEKSEQTGGSSTVTLTTANLPSHSHSYTPEGSITSTFTGSSVTTSIQSANHTHTFSGTTETETAYNSHYGVAYLHGANYQGQGIGHASPNDPPWAVATADGYSHKHKFSGTTSSNSANHTHSVTAKGTVTSTFAGTKATTTATGEGKSFSTVDPYITVYMYKRTA